MHLTLLTIVSNLSHDGCHDGSFLTPWLCSWYKFFRQLVQVSIRWSAPPFSVGMVVRYRDFMPIYQHYICVSSV
jgi:hypothetical protein